MTVSYLPLIKVQQRRHGLPVHDREFTSRLDLLAAGKAARARLMGTVLEPKQQPHVPLQAVCMPVDQSEAEDDVIGHSAPLNMLAPCSGKFLLALAACRHDVSQKDIIGRSHRRHIVAARTDAICLLYQHTQWSLPQVGRFIDRDHTTVLYALQKSGVTHKQVELQPHLAPAQKKGRTAHGLVERWHRDVIEIEPSAGFGKAKNAGEIIAEVCAAYGTTEIELRSARRAGHLIAARGEAMFRLAKEAGMTNPQIAKIMGDKDPATVHDSLRRHAARLSVSNEVGRDHG